MLVLAVAALAASQPPAAPALVEVRQAQAMVTILVSAELRFADLARSNPERFRDTILRSTDGAIQPARLIEFE